MTSAEQLEQWLKQFHQDPQKVIDDCWQHADLYYYSSPMFGSDDVICTNIVNDFKAGGFIGGLWSGDFKTWGLLVGIMLLLTTFIVAIDWFRSVLYPSAKDK